MSKTDLKQSTQSQSGEASCLRYRNLDLLRMKVSKGRELIYSPFGRGVEIVAEDHAIFLSLCQSYATIDEHALHLHRRLGERFGSLECIHERLSQFVRTGFLVTENVLVQEILDQRAQDTPPQEICRLGIPTRNRVASLKRAVTSYAEHLQQHSRIAKIIVSDGSEAHDTRLANCLALKEIAECYDIEIEYVGIEEKLRFAKLLSKETGLAGDLVESAFIQTQGFSENYGSCRNALLLHTAGDLLLQVDDDTVCRLVRPPGYADGLTLTSRSDPTEFWFFADAKHAIDSINFIEEDILSIHERILGRSVRSILMGFPRDQLDVSQIKSGFMKRGKQVSAKVTATFGGMIGDSGIGHLEGYFFLAPRSLERLLESEQIFRTSIESRQILRSTTRTSIADGTFCMANNLALDNRGLLPPFSPVQRNEDHVFASLVAVCLQGSYFGTPAVALLHSPSQERRVSFDTLWASIGTFRTNDLLSLLITAVSPAINEVGTEKRVSAMGKQLKELGAIQHQDFDEFIRILLWRAVGQKVTKLESILRQLSEGRNWWASYLEQHIARLESAVAGPALSTPIDLIAERGPQEARDCFQQFVLRFGALLEAWPELWKGAKQLRERGDPLAMRI